MAAFSFTAPRFTDEMKEAERKAMTEEERERIEAEMYGLATSDQEAKEETPEMVAEFLESFQSHLDSIEYKPTYLEAIEKCPEILETESAPIRFLRAESFDAEKAAQRMVNYWEYRKKLFGPEKTFLPLRLEGGALDALALEYLKEIPEIFWPIGPDEHGRCVFLTDKGRVDTSKKYDRKAMGRFLWYVFHVALEDVEYQHKGFVAVVLMRISHLGQIDRRLQIQSFQSLNTALPVKFRSVHLCHPPAFFSVIWPVLSFCMGTELRQRTFMRKGSDQQVMCELETCGIPREQVPRNMGGEYILDIDRWIANRKAIEAERYDNKKNVDDVDGDNEKDNEQPEETEAEKMDKEQPQAEPVPAVAEVKESTMTDKEQPEEEPAQVVAEEEDEETKQR